MRLDELNVVQRRLGNGLQLAVVPQPHVHRAVLHAQLRVGSRFESAHDNGLSHFLEHMLYRGTEQLPTAHAQSLAIERLGGALDAATSAENGTLSLVCPPESLAALTGVFAEVFQRPLLDAIDVERGIVREEILESLDENGQAIDPDDLIRALSFADHSLGQPIAGTIERLESFDKARVAAHHARFYNAANTVIVVAGAVVPEATLDQLEHHFGSLPTGAVPAAAAPAAQHAARFQYVRHNASQTQLRVAFRAPGSNNPDERVVDVLSRLLDDGMSTRLYQRICDELGLCYEVSGGYEVYSDAGLLELSAETSHDQAASVLEEMLGIVRALRDEGPGAEELEAAVRRYRWQAEGLLDDPYSLAEFTADTLLGGRLELPLHRSEQIAKITAADVQAAARHWWTGAQLSVVAVGALPRAVLRRVEQSVRNF